MARRSVAYSKRLIKNACLSLVGLLWGVLFSLSLMGCQAKQKSPPLVNQKSLVGYSTLPPDQEALLRIRMAIILQQMQRLEYPVLLESWFKVSSPQERLRWMSFFYCNDQVLGRLQSYEASQMLLLKDEKASQKSKSEVLNVHVITQRQQDSRVKELFVLQQQHLDYQIIGYFVNPKNKFAYYNCVGRL